jgi:pimeloyl-ACP methyl ester carboxylesterase
MAHAEASLVPPTTQPEFSISKQEKAPSGFYKYTVHLPLPSLNKYMPSNTPVPLDTIDLTVWSYDQMQIHTLDEFKQFISEDNEKHLTPILLLNGLMSNSEQFDRQNTSFIQKLTKAARMQNQNDTHPFIPVFIGMSGPGFTGSEVNTLPHYGPLDVGVRRYSSVIASVVDELSLPSHGALIGHSAGGAAVHQYQLDHPGDNRPKVSLCPAIHVNKAPQFETIRALLNLQSAVIGMSRILCTWSSNKVVRWLLGLPLTGTLPPSSQAQVAMHVSELDKHRDTTMAKLTELHMPLKQDEKTLSNTLTLIAAKDHLTPPKQIKKGFPNDFSGFIRMPKTHHDDIFMKDKTQDMAIPLIAHYLLTRKIDTEYAKRLGMLLH